MLSHSFSRFSTVELTDEYHIDSRIGAGRSMTRVRRLGIQVVLSRISYFFRENQRAQG